MRKTMRTAFVSAAIVGLGLAGAATAQADGSGEYAGQEAFNSAGLSQGLSVSDETGVDAHNNAGITNAAAAEEGKFTEDDDDDGGLLFGGDDD